MNNDNVGEGAEQVTLSSCGEGMAMDEASDYGVENATARVGRGFRTRGPETSRGDEANGGAGTLPHRF